MTVCWHKDTADVLLDTEALVGESDAAFMATHSPLHSFELKGVVPDLIKERTDEGLFQGLAFGGAHHALCALEGEPGSGKSHLVRWLSIQWDHRGPQDDLVILLQRRDGRLATAMLQLYEQLPAELQPDFSDLQNAVGEKEPRAREIAFFSRLADLLDSEYQRFDDSDWVDQNRLSEFVRGNHLTLRERWSAPGRIIGKVFDGSDDARDAAIFTLEDLAELVKIRVQRHSCRALFRTIKTALNSVPDLSTASFPPKSPVSRLLLALNQRLGPAFSDLLSASTTSINQVLNRLRVWLKDPATPKSRLVLLIEDVTSAQGVDARLIDALSSKSTALNSGLADMVSVIGITPGYFKNFLTRGTYEQRFTQWVVLDRQGGEGFALADPRTREQFAGRYLRAVRRPLEVLADWRWKDQERVSNRCSGCLEQPVCHRDFGAVELDGESVGLFPFTRQAIENLYEWLDGGPGQTLRTPRGLVNHVLRPTLLSPEGIDAGTFPPDGVRTSYHKTPPEARRLSRHAEVQQNPELRRFLTWWGDTEGLETRNATGNPCVSRIPRGAFEAVGLPWIGDPAARAATPEPGESQPDTEPKGEEDPSTGADTTPDGDPEPQSQLEPVEGETEPPPPPPPARDPQRVEFELLRSELDTWFRTGPMPGSPAAWEARLLKVVAPVLDDLALDLWTRGKLFTPALVVVEGTRSQTAETSLEFPRDDSTRVVLDAALTLEHEGASREEREYATIELMLERPAIERRVRAHLNRVLGWTGVGGVQWVPAELVAELLLVRSWVRGTVPPRSGEAERWRATFASEPGVEEERNKAWQELDESLKRLEDGSLTGQEEDPLVDFLVNMANLRQGATGGLRALNAAPLLDAVARVVRTGQLSPTPELKQVLHRDLRTLVKVHRELAQRLDEAVRREWGDLVTAGGLLTSGPPGTSLKQRLKDLHRAITDTDSIVPAKFGNHVRVWNDLWALCQPLFVGGKNAPVREVQSWAKALSAPHPAGVIDQVQLVVSAPHADARLLAAAAEKGTATVDAIWAWAEPIVKTTTVTKDLAKLKSRGTTMDATATRIDKLL